MDELQILINKAESLRGLLPREPKDADRCIAEVVLVDFFNFLTLLPFQLLSSSEKLNTISQPKNIRGILINLKMRRTQPY